MAMEGDTPGYTAALRRAFRLALDLGCKCGPVHLLVGLSEGDQPVAAALTLDDEVPLRSVITAADGVPGGAATYVNLQAQHGARQLAESRGEALRTEHLAIVLVDQAAPDAMGLLARAGINTGTVRKAALEGLGAPPDLPEVRLPPFIPAGTLDRPPLPVAELDQRAWAALCWRQNHLPLRHLRRQQNWASLQHLERKAVWRVASRLHLDDDQRYSLYRQHSEHVEARASLARPDLVPQRKSDGHDSVIETAAMFGRIAHRPRRRRILPFTVGWGTWFSNRWIGLRNKWFRLRTLRAYRGVPGLDSDSPR
jgi:hypothetical protein